MNDKLLANEIVRSISGLQRLLGSDHQRNINEACGYPDCVTPKEYKEMYDREGIAARVVNLWPDESWADDPEILESEEPQKSLFEEEWEKLESTFSLWGTLQRADRLSGIGEYGAVLLGIDDGMPLEAEANLRAGGGKQVRKLLYLKVFSQAQIEVKETEKDGASPRYGQPTLYAVKYSEGEAGSVRERNVHWTRIVHLADNRESSEWRGIPRMQPVYNRLFDLRKVLSGSGEMFWNGGFPGIALEANPEAVAAGAAVDKDSIREEFQNYQTGLQRYLALTGITAKSLDPQVADPGPHLEAHLKAIAIALGVPWRILLGTEEAKLASTQDSKAWNKRLRRRQEKYTTPFVVRPFVTRLIEMGVLVAPKRGWFVRWPDLNVNSEEERAKVADLRAGAMAKYLAGGVDVLIPPREFLSIIMDMRDEAVDSIMDAAGERALAASGDEDEEEEEEEE